LSRTAVLAADAGPDVGLGHVSRTGAVAAALRTRGWGVRCLALGADDGFERDGIEWEPWELDRRPPRADAIVLDSYHFDAAAARREAQRSLLVLMHDRGDPIAEAGLLVTVGGGESPRRGWLTGPRFACLRPPFWGLPIRAPRAEVEHVLVATGGGDPGGAAAGLAEACAQVLPNARVRRLRGPQAPSVAADGVEEVGPVDCPADLLLDSDLVVTAGGQGALEAIATGAACVLVPLADNQRAQVERLVAIRAAVAAEPAPEQVAAEAARLAADTPARAGLATNGQRAVDGYGALRVAFAIDARF
jgi:spore coat polysaccharide biosynthesis predicted glycosyltransferase SpsG